MYPCPTRRAAVFGVAGIPGAVHSAVSTADNWLLIDRTEIASAKTKAGENSWAKAALDDVLGSARQGLRVKAAEGTDVFTGEGPGKNPADRVPLLIIRRRSQNATFDVFHDFA